MAEHIEKPKLPPPVKFGDGGGKIVVKVSGRLKQISQNPGVKIERMD